MNTGVVIPGKPSLGAWVTYGLGTENQNLPAFVVLPDFRSLPFSGSQQWGAGFLPASYQGTVLRWKGDPILRPEAARRTSRRTMQAKRDGTAARLQPGLLGTAHRQSRSAGPHRRLRTCLSHAGRSSRACSTSGRRAARDLRDVRIERSRHRIVRQALSDGAASWWRRACASCSSTRRARSGTATRRS